jgi:RNA polymerase sigma-70 factor (ECF subfamily)
MIAMKDSTEISSEIDDERLARAAAGDPKALADVFAHYRPRLAQTVRLRMDRRLQSRIDVSDVLQEAFLDAAKRLPEYVEAPELSLFLWLRSLTTQRLVDLHRRHLVAQMRSVSLEYSLDTGDSLYASSQSLAELLVDSSISPGSKLLQLETQQRVQMALNSMDPQDREVLAMRHFEMLSNNEVATILKLSKAAASNRYVRALERLHKVLNGQFSDD